MSRATEATSKPIHDERASSGRYSKSPTCDCCGLPVGTDPVCDEEVCGSTDGPGFFLCERRTCEAKRSNLSVEGRRALYQAVRQGEPILSATIGPTAACVLGLDGAGVEISGIVSYENTRRGVAVRGTARALQSLAEELVDRGDARSGWCLCAAERAACRRAAAALSKRVARHHSEAADRIRSEGPWPDCPACGGDGYGEDPGPCPACKGSGKGGAGTARGAR